MREPQMVMWLNTVQYDVSREICNNHKTCSGDSHRQKLTTIQ